MPGLHRIAWRGAYIEGGDCEAKGGELRPRVFGERLPRQSALYRWPPITVHTLASNLGQTYGHAGTRRNNDSDARCDHARPHSDL